MGPFIDPSTVLAMLLMLLSAGVRDLAGCLSTDAYWHAKNVVVSVDQLIGELNPIQPADISKLIGDLDADDPKTRDAATAKIADIGPAAIPGLTESVKNGSPEVIARANALLARIRAGAKSASVRRLMAIRTLGEKKDAAALPVLRSLLDSKEMFEADYAKAAIAKIEGKPYSPPVATDAERAGDVSLLPSRLDAVAQIAPQYAGEFSVEKIVAQLPIPDDRKAKARDEANVQILKVLETLGNVRLDAVTWGFYAAPPGQPGNTIVVVRGAFDPAAVAAMLGQEIGPAKKVNGFDVYQIDDDSAVLLSNDGRLIYLGREPGGELGLEAMTLALRKGSGEFAANPDLPALMKTVDLKAPLWAVTKMAPGLKEIVGPLGKFDSATLVATQSMEKETLSTDIRLQATAADPATAKEVVENVTTDLKSAIEDGRKEEKNEPMLKPMVDFAESIKLKSDGQNATLSASLRGTPIFPAMIVGRQAVVMPAPNGIRH